MYKHFDTTRLDSAWKLVVNDEADHGRTKIWRRPVEGTTVMEYHYWGVYPNIDASTFAKAALLDMDFKKSYDKHMLRSKVIEARDNGKDSLLYWEVGFPFPMSNRDYVYRRRYDVIENNGKFTMYNM